AEVAGRSTVRPWARAPPAARVVARRAKAAIAQRLGIWNSPPPRYGAAARLLDRRSAGGKTAREPCRRGPAASRLAQKGSVRMRFGQWATAAAALGALLVAAPAAWAQAPTASAG